MANTPTWRRILEPILSIGSYPGEPEIRSSGRRVFIVAFILGTLLSTLQPFANLDAGQTWIAVMNFFTTFVLGPLILVAIWLRPRRFTMLVTLMLGALYVRQLVQTAMFGGLLPSGLVVTFGLALALAAMIAISWRAAIWWLAAFAVSVVYAVLVADWVDPIYALSNPAAVAAFNLIVTGLLTIASLAYFVRQRDRYQERSDDLLHNILPDEITARLKDGGTMIADVVPSASVLFADVVGFTPMSAGMSPLELVTLLNEVFTRFDGFVAELGLEKIKTVGDEYMAAGGVPRPRPDHAHAIAELALRMRDHLRANPIQGHHLSLRIGINSGPLTAGIIGTHKFAYDLWGDTVNTASRMESEGIPGSIQVSPATYELIKETYECDARGSIPVKGKSSMMTYLLISRRDTAVASDG
jgi:adenylate cyclase